MVMTPTRSVLPGIYLEDNPPARSQFLTGRRNPGLRPVIVVHTAESKRSRAVNVAQFIQGRSDPGSYHLLGDETEIVQLVGYGNEAFQDGTGSNRWAIGISLAMDAAEWGDYPNERTVALLGTAVDMATLAGRWLDGQGHGWPMPARLTKAASDRPDASGFIAHGDRDPTRRTDPGAAFPWEDFLEGYATAPLVAVSWLERFQQDLLDAGLDIGAEEPDNDFGPAMHRTCTRLLYRAALWDSQAELYRLANNDPT